MKTARFVSLTLLFFYFLLGVDCHNATEPPPNGTDTTSHDFTWTTYEFGAGASNAFHDVAILDDSVPWVVGEVYDIDSSGNPSSLPFNVAAWNGSSWSLTKVTNMAFRACVAFSRNDIWCATSAPYHWDGAKWTGFNITGKFGGYANALWGTSTSNLFMVGTNGAMIHFDGSSWTTLQSGTVVDFHDIWGSVDRSTVWACGYTSDLSQSCILKCDGVSWTTLWSTTSVLTPPYGQLALSLWASSKYLYVAADGGVYRTPLNGNAATERVLALPAVPFRIRGSGENNIAVACGDGSIWHYNGATWARLQEPDLPKPVYSIAVSENFIVAVGFDASSMNTRGRICMGRRK